MAIDYKLFVNHYIDFYKNLLKDHDPITALELVIAKIYCNTVLSASDKKIVRDKVTEQLKNNNLF